MTADTTVREAPPRDRWHQRIARRLEKRWQRVAAAVGGLATFVGLVTGGWEVYDHLFPPRPPQKATVVVEKTSLINVPLRRFFKGHRAFGGGRRFTEAELETAGAVFTLDLALKGLADTDTFVKWRLTDPDLGQVRALPPWAPRSEKLRPKGDDVTLSPEVWVPYPSGPSGTLGEVVARFTVGSKKHAQLGAPAVSQRIEYFVP